MIYEAICSREPTEAEKQEMLAKAQALTRRATKVWHEDICPVPSMQFLRALPEPVQLKMMDMFVSGYVSGFVACEDFMRRNAMDSN